MSAEQTGAAVNRRGLLLAAVAGSGSKQGTTLPDGAVPQSDIS